MINPPSRNAGEGFLPGDNVHGCNGEACMFFSQGCTIGCDCNEDNNNLHFFNNLCHNKMEPTINDPELLTYSNPIKLWYGKLLGANWTKYHPWRAPGSALPLNPCGLAGGSTKNNDVAGGFGKSTIAGIQGFPGSELPRLSHKTVWTKGSTVEVAWAITANHGGGYQYRACPFGHNLTESCFRRQVLPFVGNTQKLRWNNGQESEIPATRTSIGTQPEGSTWTKNPIPACSAVEGGEYGRGCDRPEFTPPPGCNETCWGKKVCKYTVPADNCTKYPDWRTTEMPQIVDHVHVDLVPGEWVLQWRWDSEETPQVWNSCADLTVI